MNDQCLPCPECGGNAYSTGKIYDPDPYGSGSVWPDDYIEEFGCNGCGYAFYVAVGETDASQN